MFVELFQAIDQRLQHVSQPRRDEVHMSRLFAGRRVQHRIHYRRQIRRAFDDPLGETREIAARRLLVNGPFVCGQGHVARDLCLVCARQNGTDADAKRPHLGVYGSRQAAEGGFGGAVGAQVGGVQQGAYGAHENDASRSLLPHVRQHRPTQCHGTKEVCLEHAPEGLVVQDLYGANRGNAGVVHQYVDTPVVT